MEEAPENGKESPHSVHANGLIDSLATAWTPHVTRTARFSQIRDLVPTLPPPYPI